MFRMAQRYHLDTYTAQVSIALKPNIELFMHCRNSDGFVSPPMHIIWLGWKGYTCAALLLA